MKDQCTKKIPAFLFLPFLPPQWTRAWCRSLVFFFLFTILLGGVFYLELLPSFSSFSSFFLWFHPCSAFFRWTDLWNLNCQLLLNSYSAFFIDSNNVQEGEILLRFIQEIRIPLNQLPFPHHTPLSFCECPIRKSFPLDPRSGLRPRVGSGVEELYWVYEGEVSFLVAVLSIPSANQNQKDMRIG